MPWTSADASKFTHRADSPRRKRMWRDIANQQLKRHEGESRAEEIAVRSANAAVAEDHRKEKSRFFSNLRYLLGG